MYILSDFAERLEELMIDNNLNQSQLAEKIHVEDSTISRYLSEQKVPEVEILIRLADYFNCSVDFLAGRTEVISIPNIRYKNCPAFSIQFKKVVEYFKISKYKLQKEAKLAKTVMYYWETGKYQPTIENLIKLANYYDCSLDFILGRVDFE